MEKRKRILSAFLALVLVLGMLPMPAAATELSIGELTEAAETTVPTTLPEETAVPVETEAAETEPELTETQETIPEETAVETESQETEPEETAAETEAETEADDEGIVSASMTQSQFDQLLAEAKRTGTLNLNEQVTLTKNVTIPENVRFNIDWAGGIVVPSGKTLTICGRGNIYGTLQVQAGGTLAIAGENPTWVCSGATVEIQGTYTHGEYLGILYRFAENGEFRHTLTGVSDRDMGSYIQVRDDSNWAGVLDIFRNPDYMYVTIGVQGNVTLPEDVTAGANRAICVEGTAGSTLTIPEGVTLTTKSALTVYENYNIVNNGRIVFNTDNGQSVQIMGRMTNNGTIETGRFCWFYVNGELTNNGQIVNGWDIYVNGKITNYGNIDMVDTETADYYSLLLVEESGQVDNHGSVDCYGAGAVHVAGTWNGNDPVYHSLPQPINLSWHKMVRQGSVQNAKGYIYWQAVNPQDNSNDRYQIYIYNADTNEVVYRDSCSFGGMQTNDRSLPSFIEADLPSGNYYFTVTALSNNDAYEDSAPVRSDVFSYTRPASSIGGARNLHWNGPNAYWDAPSKADSLTTYTVQWYYASDADSEPRMRAGDVNVYGTSKNLPPWMVESCGAGYYSFKVRAIPGDGTRYTVGDWVESGQFYYDPATFAYDESYLVNLHTERPQGMSQDIDFKFLNAPVVLQNDLALPENTFLDINRGGSITVPAGKTLTLNHQTQVYNGGKLIVEEGGKLIVNAYFWLGFNGTLDVRGEIEFAENQWIYVNFGNEFTLMNGVSDDKVFKEFLFDPGLGRVEDLLNEFENSTYGWNVMRVEGEMSLPRSITTPERSNLYIAENGSLTIPENVTLSISGDAQMTVVGKLYNNGTIQGNNQGTGPEAVIYVPEMGYVRNNGRVIANIGTVVDVRGTWEGNDPWYRGGDITLPMPFKEFKSQVDAAAKSGIGGIDVVLTKTVVLESNFTIPKNISLRLQNSGTIIVPRGKTLTLNNVSTWLYLSGKLIVEDGGSLKLNGGVLVSDNSRMVVNGTCTVGNGGSVTVNYGSASEVVGVPMENQILRLIVTSDQVDWHEYLDIFADNDYGSCYLYFECDAIIDRDVIVPENGNLEISARNAVTNNSTIKNYGKIRVGGTLNNNSHVYCYYGGEVLVEKNGIWNGNPAENVGFMTQDQLEQEIANNAYYELNDVVVLERDLVLADKEFTVGAEGRLIVPKGVTLTVNYATYVRGKLEVEKGGKLVQNDWLMVYPGGTILNAGTYVAPKNECFLEVFSNEPSLPRVEGIAKKYQRLQFDDVDLTLLNYAIGLQKEGYAAIRLYSGGLTLNEDVTIPKVITLVVINENLTVNSSLILNGAMVVDREATLVNTGSFTLNKGGELYFYGTWEGKQPVNKGGITYPNAAAVVIEGDDTLTLDSVQAAGREISVRVEGQNTQQYGENYLQFVTWTSSNKKVIDPADIVYENGVYKITKAGAGTTKLTATSVATDVNGKTLSDTVTLTVTAVQTESLTLDPDELMLEKADHARTFVITPEAMDKYGNTMALNSKSLKWATSDSKLASLKVNADGSATVTVAAGKDGTAVITAQTTDLAQRSASMTVTVYDRAPKLVSSKITLNPMLLDGADLGLIPGHENPVVSISVNHEDLETVYSEATGSWILKAVGQPKNGTIKTSVLVNGTHELPLTVTVKSAIPTLTIKQNGKLDLFYTDSWAFLTVSAKDAVVEKLELAGTDDFEMTETGEIRFADSLPGKFTANAKYKPNAKATLKVYLEGYAYPAEKAITIGTSATKLNLTTDPSSSTVNVNDKFGAVTPTVSFRLYDKGAKQILNLEGATIRVAGYEDKHTVENNRITLTLNAPEKSNLMISVQKENWMQPVTVKHAVAVTDKDPTVKLMKSALKLNTNLPGQTDATEVILSSGNLTVDFGEFQSVKTDENADRIAVVYDETTGEIRASLAGNQMPKAGTYSFTAVPSVGDVALEPVTVKVTVSAAAPKVTLGAKGKLDTIDAESQIVYSVSKISDGRLESVALKQGANLFEISQLQEDDSGKQFFTLSLQDGVTYFTKQTYTVSFAYRISGETFESAPVKVKVSQSSPKVKASLGEYRQGQSAFKLDVALTAPENAKMTAIKVNQDKTSRELLEAFEIREGNMLFFFLASSGMGSETVSTNVTLRNPGALAAGKTYKLALEITVQGQAGDVKGTQITLNLKVAK